MKYISELVDLVTRNKVKNLSTLDLHTSPRTHVNRLYQAIAEGEVDSDDDAAALLFSDPKDRRYNKVKYELRQRLLNTIFFIDVNKRNTSEADQAFYTLYRNYTVATILWKLGVRNNAVKMLEKLLPKSQEFELTEIVVGTARRLKYYYSVIEKKRRLYNEYRQISKTWEKIQREEYEIGDFREELTAFYVDTFGSQRDINARQRSHQILEQIHNHSMIDTLYYQFSRYFILVVYYMSNHQYRDTIDICKEALAYLDSKKIAPNSYRRIFLLQIMASSITLKDYVEGEKAIQDFAYQRKTGTLPWFYMREMQLMLYLHSKRYNDANDIFVNTFNLKKIYLVEPGARERWIIYEAHLQWLIEIGKITNLSPEQRNFRIGRFLNEVPIYTKDKEGMNIPILIIQVLWLVAKEDYEGARNKISLLGRYHSRYLKKDEMYRTQLFMRMLGQLSKGNFHRVAVQRKAKSYYDKLKIHPLAVAQQSWRIEIIPYEHLWEFVTEMLDLQLH